MFFQEKCLFSIPIPFRTLCWLCFVQSLVCPYFGILAENPFPRERGYITGATAPDQARMLAVSHTKPLHDAVAQMDDDLYGGYAPATPFLNNQEVYRQSRRNSPTFFIFPIDKSPVSVYTVYITHKQFDCLLCDVSLLI